jgi:uncharacterized membrane protein YgdD (TMEM256/DUF423 family)
MNINPWLVAGALAGLLGVTAGAFGAHALRNVLENYGRSLWDLAVFYHMIHALALLAVGMLRNWNPRVRWHPAGLGFAAGIVLFSGSLYLLALTGIRALGMITPFGGTAFLFGWVWVAYGSLRAGRRD